MHTASVKHCDDASVLIDSLMPDYDVTEHHEELVDATPENTLAAVRRFDASKSIPIAILMAVRGLPHLLRGKVRPGRGMTVDFLLDQGFQVVAEASDELVLGVVGKFWHLDSGIVRVNADDFMGFDEPGYAKAAWNFYVESAAGRTRLVTETRVAGTDEPATRKFRLYWMVVGPFSALIRRLMLGLIKREAESVPTGP